MNSGALVNTDEKNLDSNTLYLGKRTASNAQSLSKNGVDLFAGATASSSVSSETIQIGRFGVGTAIDGTISTFIIGAATNFDQATHYTNHLQYLIDLGTFAGPVLARYTGLTQLETDSITKFVNAEVIAGNWGLYDEFFCFSLAGANALIGMKSKTASLINAPTLDIDGVHLDGVNQYINSNFLPGSDGVNYQQDNALYGAFVKENLSAPDANKTLIGGWENSVGTNFNSILQETAATRATVSGGSNVTSSEATIQNNSLYLATRTTALAIQFNRNGIEEAETINSTSAISFPLAMFIGCRNGNGVPSQFLECTISTAIFGASVGFDQSAHYTNHLNLLIELGVFAQPVLDRYSALTQTETDAITAFVNAEVRAGNWGLYDEFFCFSLNATDRLIGFKSKTATLIGVPTFDINGATFNGIDQAINTNYNPTNDAVNYKQDDAMAGIFAFSNPDDAGGSFMLSGGNTLTSMRNSASGSTLGLNSGGDAFATTDIPDNTLIVVRRIVSTEMVAVTNGNLGASRALASTGIDNNSFLLAVRQSLSNWAECTISTAIFGGAIGFNQSAHNTNQRKLLTDLGVTLP